jgi:hypothetical protein
MTLSLAFSSVGRSAGGTLGQRHYRNLIVMIHSAERFSDCL